MDRLPRSRRVGPFSGTKAVGLALLVAVLTLAACTRQNDPVAADVQSVKDRTVPRNGRLIPGDSRRHDQALRVTWDIEAEMSWNDYAAWLKTRLPEFRLVSHDAEALRFGRALEGDAYSVTVKRSTGEGSLLAHVSFEARPF
jgi:hypothetical protein